MKTSIKLTKKEKARIARALENDGLSRRALADAVRREALRRGLSRDDMAAITKDAASQMSRLMTGHDDEFSADRLVKMLTRLGRSVTLYIGRPRRSARLPRVADLETRKITRGAR